MVSINAERSDLCLKVGNREMRLSDIRSVWFRGGDLIEADKLSATEFGATPLGVAATAFLQWEWSSLNVWANSQLMQKHHLGNPFIYDTNKLVMLEKAKAAGFNIPITRVLFEKPEAIRFYEECNGQIISKAVYNSFHYREGERVYGHPTLKVTAETLFRLPQQFGPSLFQQQIRKRVELRCCIVGEQIFCGAIFSQINPKTRVDFRQYDFERPNRSVPYRLPQDVCNKLLGFMRSVNLNFGLIDMILTDDYEYFFLEVNPIGQFDSLCASCGFPIEQEIVNFLLSHHDS